MSANVIPAHDLKPGDRIEFTFRGGPNKLGAVEVFDAVPQAANNHHSRPTVVLVLRNADGFHHRKVEATLGFAVS